MADRTVADIIADECIYDDADLVTLQAMLDENERLREELGEAEHQIATCDQAVLREALLEGVLAARALGTPVCEDGFRHCCGGPRSGCRDSCANKFLVEWAKRHAALSGSSATASDE